MRAYGKKPKYKNRKIVYDGITFDSIKECNRYKELKLLERAGLISGLQLQVEYLLIPPQRINGKVVERAVKYKADFVYHKDGGLVVEDTKGMRTKDYIIKRKLMLQVYGIRVNEV